MMIAENKSLVLDMVEWIAAKPRLYNEVMEAWRSSCPRLTIWEDATALGLVSCRSADGETTVQITDAGRDLLREEGRCER